MIKWELSMIKLKGNGKKYKVTRRVPDLKISETKVFDDKMRAIDQFEEWIHQS